MDLWFPSPQCLWTASRDTTWTCGEDTESNDGPGKGQNQGRSRARSKQHWSVDLSPDRWLLFFLLLAEGDGSTVQESERGCCVYVADAATIRTPAQTSVRDCLSWTFRSSWSKSVIATGIYEEFKFCSQKSISWLYILSFILKIYHITQYMYISITWNLL